MRLRQGDYAQETVYDEDPADAARRWVEQGARSLHIVDLDGARQGRPANSATIRRMVAAAAVPCQLGGGLRCGDHVREALDWGIERVVIGTRALEDREWFGRLCRRHPGRILLGIDAKNGLAATDGWQATSAVTALELARRFQDLPLAGLVCTDISRDGMLEGPNLAALAELVAAAAVPVIASGGMTTVEDIRRVRQAGAAGCIIGRALYEGRLNLAAAMAAAERDENNGGPAVDGHGR